MLPFLVPVESHSGSRVPARVPEPVPEASAQWGRASGFTIEDPKADPWAMGEDADAEEARRGGFSITWPQKHIYTSRTIDMTPVWRRYDVAEVTAYDDPEVKIEVAVTRAMLFPIRSETLRYVGGGSYVLDPGGQAFEERVIHSYLLLELPILVPGWTIKAYGLTEGAWPTYRQEMFPPGPFA